ncbi:MAG: histidine triad nucleotide-binding protein [Planctomycetes bacterium]|nr:histidine triad nucleotide-binding protein [Planctomycetota bacterium]
MEKDPACIFCKIIAGEIPSEKVYEDDLCLAFRDIEPQAPTHILLIPKKHLARLDQAGSEDCELMGHLLEMVGHIARQEELCKEGFRTVIDSGKRPNQLVPHLHLHILGGRDFAWPPG